MNDELIMTLMTHMRDASKPELELIKLYVEALERMNDTQRAELAKLAEMANGLSETDRQDFMSNMAAYAWRIVDGEPAAQIMASWKDERTVSFNRTRDLIEGIIRKGFTE